MHDHNHDHDHNGSGDSEGSEGSLVLDVLLSYCNTNPIMNSWLAFFDDCDGQVFRNGRRLILLVSEVDESIYNSISTPRRRFSPNRTYL